VGVGLLAAGLAALVIALVRPTEPARAGLPAWVWVTVVAVLVAGVGVMVPRSRPDPVWWRLGLGVGAVVLGTWAVFAGVADVRSGLPGSAIPWLAVGCVALLVAAVLLGVSSPAPLRRRSVVRQALPAILAVVIVVASAVAVDMVGWRLPVDATTTTEDNDTVVPDLTNRVRWTSTWPELDGVVAAGAGVVVASGDRVVALDGASGDERWHYRRAGARVVGLTATDYAVVAEIAAGGENSSSALFVFDAYTGELHWTRPPGDIVVVSGALVERMPDGRTLVGFADLNGKERWTWTPPPGCELNGSLQPARLAVLVPVICRDPAGRRYYAVIGVDGAYGGQRWRYDGPPATVADPPDAELTMSPDQKAARYRPRDPGAEPVLLYTFIDGVLLYRVPDGTEIVAFDEVHAVLRRNVRGTGQLLLRSLVTKTERPLGSTCPALERSDGASRVSSVVTPRTEEFAGNVLVLCFDDREGAPRADVDVYSSDGARHTTVEVATSAIPPELLVAPDAVVVVQYRDSGPDVLLGLG
jgi:hypothetical protein